MQVSPVPVQVVRAAAAGDRRALDTLAGAYLPLVYHVVRRSAESDLDVDDIVQETMIRVIGGISGVREEDRLRSWVVTIALRQLTEARQRAGRERVRRSEQMPDRRDPAVDIERSVALRLVLTDEQHELERAAAWLDDGHRETLTLWWLEARGDLGRAESAAAFGEPVAHFGVRVQRMRQQLDTARAIVRVLAAEPRCPDLVEVLASWDGAPTSLWRKRIAAHLRDCAWCADRSARLTDPALLLASLPLVVPPPHLWTTVPTCHTGLLNSAHPVQGGGGGGGGHSGATANSGNTFFGVGAAKVAATAATVVLLAGGIAAVVVARAGGGERPRPAAALPTSATRYPSANPVPSGSPSASAAPRPSSSPAATSPAASTFRTVVPKMPTTVSVQDIGAVRQNARVAGRDNGQSAGYDGRSVWIFDDTTLKNPWGFLSNSAAMTTDRDASNGIDLRSGNGFAVNDTQTPVELIPRTAAEKAFEKANSGPGCSGQYCGAVFGFWPGPVIADPARNRVLVTYGKLCRGGKAGTPCSGPLGKGLGMGIAALDMTSGVVTRLTAPPVTSVEGSDRTIFFGPGTTGFGSAAALVVDGSAYLYGGCIYQGCQLARVPLAAIADRSAWRYYASGKWLTDPSRATRIALEPGAAGQTVYYSAGLRAYVNVFMPYGSNDVRYQVGGSPFGPWSKSVKLLTTPAGSSPNYALFGHPEFAQQNGLVQYLSYFNPSTGAQRLIRWQARP